MTDSVDKDDSVDLSPDALARAEAALARLSDDYLRWVEADLAAAQACLDSGDLSRLYTIVHDIKGQAATFGYPLVTAIGTRLCQMLHAPSPPQSGIFRLLHSMQTVISHRLTDDGGAQGRELLKRLD
ncbi:Hpt domain-containing protein [Magnetospirillum sulfuroxidans]|uniref:Hpt domain-containing protein n=1 Tax=Magnetospirillum sulfuroxidans TaxID=611300 RepID=A0ABS5IEU5_9PROT|nr:Hpt domain-containing protein [Magnetospirillum sulfuroxidans]MBR9972937.1 Hpt domain-containing protein [Magnetospirillum sulfuroxidans]